MHTKTPALLAALLAALLLPTAAAAPPQVLSLSTNNTPLDRAALRLLSEEALGRLGMGLRLVGLPSERSLVAADQGEVDGEGLRIAGLEASYPNLVQVPERYIGISFVAFAKDANLRVDAGWESLRPHRVAFIGGWKMFEAHASAARVVHKVDSPEQIFRMLEAGRIDLGLYTLADGVALTRELGLGSIAPLRPALKDVDMYLYLHRRHLDLVPRLAQALRDMKADGTYNRILASIAAP